MQRIMALNNDKTMIWLPGLRIVTPYTSCLPVIALLSQKYSLFFSLCLLLTEGRYMSTLHDSTATSLSVNLSLHKNLVPIDNHRPGLQFPSIITRRSTLSMITAFDDEFGHSNRLHKRGAE